jgi:hypothetical protein
MSDLVDRAALAQEQALSDEIAAARKHLNQSPKPTGYCLYCGEPQEDPNRRFCDADCAADAENYGTIDGRYIPVSDQTRISRGTMPKYLTR